MSFIEICSADICIATYKRPELLKLTLQSLLNLEIPASIKTRIILVDNDSEKSAEGVVNNIQKVSSIEILYHNEPTKNISLARNAAIALSRSDIILFIDDDEIACSDWLVAHIKALDKYNADVIVGPTHPVFTDDTPNWIIDGGYFLPPDRREGIPRKTAATGNTSLRRSAIPLNKPHFLPAFGLTGGGDNEFFSRLYSQGKKIIWSNQPVVHEEVHKSRQGVRWLLLRSFRAGQGHTRIYYGNKISQQSLLNFGLNLILIGQDLILLLLLLPFGKVRYVKALQNLGRHAGKISAYSNIYFNEYSR